MNINLTLLGEMITFAVLVIVTMKYIWPPITKAMQDREKKIADGLAAAERGQRSLELAQEDIKKRIKEAKSKADAIVDQANSKMAEMLEHAREHAQTEGKKIIALAEADIARAMETAKHELRQQVADLVISASQKILEKNIDEAANRALINKCIEEL